MIDFNANYDEQLFCPTCHQYLLLHDGMMGTRDDIPAGWECKPAPDILRQPWVDDEPGYDIHGDIGYWNS